jgi:hypothetical protein
MRARGPRFGFAQTRAYPPRLLRDEEAAGSNPATPTGKFQVDGMIAKCGDHAIDHLLAIRWRDRTQSPARREEDRQRMPPCQGIGPRGLNGVLGPPLLWQGSGNGTMPSYASRGRTPWPVRDTASSADGLTAR